MVKPLARVTKDDIKDATLIEAMIHDGKSDPETIWRCDGKHLDTTKRPGQPYARGNTLVVQLHTKADLPTLQAMVSDVAGRDITKD